MQMSLPKHHLSRFFILLALISLFSVIFVQLLIPTRSASASMNENRETTQPEKMQITGKQLEPFVGQWSIHFGLLTIDKDGSALYTARTYEKCSPGVKEPCDTWEGNTIQPGIKEKITFTHWENGMMYGTIIDSTLHAEGKRVTARLLENDTIDFNGKVLCGPQAPPGYCGA